jgi:hypothetical protein
MHLNNYLIIFISNHLVNLISNLKHYIIIKFRSKLLFLSGWFILLNYYFLTNN